MQINLDRFPGGKTKALTMSYDDGVVYDRRLVEIFNKYKIKATFNLNSGLFGLGEGLYTRIQEKEVIELYAGHEIAAHTVTHPNLKFLSKTDVVDEVLTDRKNLEDLIGMPVRGMAYPFGSMDISMLDILSNVGIEYARTVNSHGKFDFPENYLLWNPTCHHSEAALHIKEFMEYSNRDNILLFYVWGHSYEFEREDNWCIIEDFCKNISNDPNVWYATNIEILDYMNAVRNLRFGVSKNFVYNPTSIDVWIDADGKDLKISAGETKKLV